MDKAFEDDNLIINPHCRCIYCRAVQIINKETYETNLYTNSFGLYVCKDKKECEQNFMEESTQVIKVSHDEDSITFEDTEENIVTYKEKK